ncbi:prepilin-type N-terminal cleavage/methylation domain-containing protein [Undibacterium sp. Jales W-56]|uniref:PulJ/GspJ family protein n=1 Tax=Undibacterium sp. Jales W-56 TaxID=2897325 RepID=UPI0021CE19ED|nr:prepilin-type N-terminal cleavage/methylation domain-containing protein [Undibacterium sp. Jales W-56]MCU6434930.1 prepilin-type N-terminal cleavage/methylation domain-containing protein [Undibacterium sp. Jales W-56]
MQLIKIIRDSSARIQAGGKQQRQRGFSLLEMIAALTILTIGSVVLFSWLGQTMGQLNRFQLQEKESLARLQAIDFLSTQNPFLTPDGKQVFDSFSMEWKSKPISEVRETVSPNGGLGLYQMSLYTVQVVAYDKAGKSWFEFPVRLVGYKQVRQPAKATPF